MIKYVDFQISSQVIKISYFDEVRFPEWKSVSGYKIHILIKYVDFQKCIPVSGYKIYILMRYVDFPKCIPVSGYKDIYFDKVR